MHRRHVPAIAERAAALLREWRSDSRETPPAQGPSSDRLAALEARVAHLEAGHEGLQDAVHRRSIHDDRAMAELRQRTQPDHIARELNNDARRRGL